MAQENEKAFGQRSLKRKSSGDSAAIQNARRLHERKYRFKDWNITVLKSSILPSNCYCQILDKENTKGLLLELGCGLGDVKLPAAASGGTTGTDTESDKSLSAIKCHVCRYKNHLSLTHYPDMVFPDNCVHLVHETSGIVLEFNTLNAMKLISTQDTESIKVACSEVWQASRKKICNEIRELKQLPNYNWTFTNNYQGTLRTINAGDELKIINNPPEKIDIEKLKKREDILFYDDVTLFEDELHDSGISSLNVKLRVMPSGFFILLRHILRVDHVMVKICDTKIHYECGNTYFLRQFQTKQALFKTLDIGPLQFSDINTMSEYLPVTSEVTEKVLLE